MTVEDRESRIEDGKIQFSFCDLGRRYKKVCQVNRVNSVAVLDPPFSILDRSGVL